MLKLVKQCWKKTRKNNRYNEKIDITNIWLLSPSVDICQVNAQMVTLCINQIRANAWPVGLHYSPASVARLRCERT